MVQTFDFMSKKPTDMFLNFLKPQKCFSIGGGGGGLEIKILKANGGAKEKRMCLKEQ